MESRAKLLGHPIHQILIVFPAGLLAASFFFDLAAQITESVKWSGIAYWLIITGIVSGLIAAVFGLIDWLAIPPKTRAKRIGIFHAAANVLMLGIFFYAWMNRSEDIIPGMELLALSLLGVSTLGVSGWLGGELVNRLGVGVYDNASLDSPSSLNE